MTSRVGVQEVRRSGVRTFAGIPTRAASVRVWRRGARAKPGRWANRLRASSGAAKESVV